uniref:Uncharacterized protein n=1 Tax=Anguilla anguilla TaxID=7936 RepID=A0A0E9SI79_ANGAN
MDFCTEPRAFSWRRTLFVVCDLTGQL